MLTDTFVYYDTVAIVAIMTILSHPLITISF